MSRRKAQSTYLAFLMKWFAEKKRLDPQVLVLASGVAWTRP